LSSYVHGHYGDLDPVEDEQGDAMPGGISTLFKVGMELVGEIAQGPMIDIGCSAGRSAFTLAEQTDDLVLGVDLNFSMLKTALDVLNTGSVSYPRRSVGMVYDRREFCVNFANRDRIDFWVCDALMLPFSSASFAFASSMNLLDCVSSPHSHLESLERILLDNGKVMIASPYDWSSSATAPEAWIGGHSQRSDNKGRSEAHIKDLFKGGNNPARIEGLKLIGEKECEPWAVRLHERSVMKYQVHLLAAEKESL
jgi:SAM-dependent methyltransferase